MSKLWVSAGPHPLKALGDPLTPGGLLLFLGLLIMLAIYTPGIAVPNLQALFEQDNLVVTIASLLLVMIILFFTFRSQRRQMRSGRS